MTLIWRVDTRTQECQRQDISNDSDRLGGRGLIARLLLEEVPPACDPLGPHNKLIITPGLLVGHMLSSCDRISMGAKSPLTGGVKESNAGGTTGLAMAYLGIRALILEDQPIDKQWRVLHVSKNGIRFDSGEELVGLGIYETASRLLEKYGDKIAASVIGPGGEMQLLVAGVANFDKDKMPSRINGRGGMGAVMGSKYIKAIVFDPADCDKPSVAHLDDFKAAQKRYTKAVVAHPQTAVYRDYGTAGMAMMCNSFGALPTNGFSSGSFEQAEAISGETMRELLLERGGKGNPSHACMAGCAIRCSNVYGDEEGKVIVSPLEYETIALMGSNLGMDNLDIVARLNWEVNDLGLDSIDIGAALGVAVQAGLMDFGDGKRALALLEETRQGTPLGRIIGNGAALAGKALGIRRVPVVKNQAMSGYDPRAIKGTGVTYATSPQGADHTCGLTIRAKVDHLDPAIQADLSRTAQINMAGYDTLGACIMSGFGFSTAPEVIRDLLNARYDWEVGEGILQELGCETLSLEREFNRRAGFTPADDRLPEWMTTEALPPTNAVFDVSAQDLDGVFNW